MCREPVHFSGHPLHRKSARFGGIVAHPIRFLKWTGCLKYRPISYTAFNAVPFDDPSLFNALAPPGPVTEKPWTKSKAIDMSMAHTVVIENGITNCLGYVFDRKGRLIDGATHKHREGRKYQRWIKRTHLVRPHPKFPKMEHYDGKIAVLTASTQRFYFHWLLEVLPRLGMILKLQENVDLIYIETKSRFQKESLEMLGINKRRIIPANDVALLTAKKLIVPCHQIMNGREFPSWAIQYVRDHFLPACTDKVLPAKKRIYISRGNTQHRRLHNERIIIDKLRDYGFLEVKAEDMAFQEQIKLFRDAEAIVAPHGSGLANIVFCSPGTKVIELFPAGNMDLYYRLSMALQLSYYYVKDRNGDPSCWTLDNYSIAWEDLRTTLDMAAIAPGTLE